MAGKLMGICENKCLKEISENIIIHKNVKLPQKSGTIGQTLVSYPFFIPYPENYGPDNTFVIGAEVARRNAYGYWEYGNSSYIKDIIVRPQSLSEGISVTITYLYQGMEQDCIVGIQLCPYEMT